MSQIDFATPDLDSDSLTRAARGAARQAVLERAPRVVWTLQATLLAMGDVSLIAAAAVSAWFMTGMVVPWDSKNHFYAMYRFLGEAVARGEIPLWNPFHFGGYPAVADPQSLIFTPTMFLFAALFPQASMQAFDAMVFSHLLIGGFGVLGLCRRRGWHPTAAVLAASIFMLGGPAASRLQHTGMIISYGFIPVALLMLEYALERVSFRYALAFGVTAALMAVGRDQVAFLACYMLIGVVVWQTLAAERPLVFLRDRALILLVMGITGAALLVVPSVLTMQFLATSNRPEISFGVAVAGSLAPVNFATMFAPNVFGSLNWTYDYWGPGYETIAEPDWTDRAINYLFIGTLPAVLLVWHGIAGGRLLGKSFRFFLTLGVVALVYAIGRYTPIFAWMFDFFPGVTLYRRPADATFELNIALAMAAGYLVNRFIHEGLPQPSLHLPKLVAVLLMVTAIGLTGLLVGSAIAFSITQTHASPALDSLALALAITLGGVALLILMRRPDRRALAAALLVAFTGAELVWRNSAASLNAEPAASYAVYSQLCASQEQGLAVLRKELAMRADRGDHPRVEILGLGGAWQNASMALGLENTLGYNPLRISDYERAVGPGENAVDPNLRHYPGTFRGYRCALASLLGLEYLILDRPLNRMPRHVPRPLATQLFAGDHMYIYRLGHVAARAYLATSVRPVDREDALSDHVLPDFDVSREVLIDQTSLPDLKAQYNSPEAADSSVKIAAYHDDRVLIDVDTPKDGILVLHDIWYPGWTVTVDGVQKTVLRANVLFRGVEVAAGHHLVSFEFHPLSVANLKAAASGLLQSTED